MTSYNTNKVDRPIHILNNQWQTSVHFNRLMVGQYDVIFHRPLLKLQNNYLRIYKLAHHQKTKDLNQELTQPLKNQLYIFKI